MSHIKCRAADSNLSGYAPDSFTPGKRTLGNFLAAALQPVGQVLYVYGGGWNYEDSGGDEASASIGLADTWRTFFEEQDASYSYQDYRTEGSNRYHALGLDCSGYVGWAVYNTMCDQGGRPSCVVRASEMAYRYAEHGWGTFCGGGEISCGDISCRDGQTFCGDISCRDGQTFYGDISDGDTSCEDKKMPSFCENRKMFPGNCEAADFQPGDIFSMDGHVWICMGACRDKSLVIAHATPSPSRLGCPGGGVQLSAVGADDRCEALRLADDYMRTHCPAWYCRYKAVRRDIERYTTPGGAHGGHFRWHSDARGLPDPDGLAGLEAGEILRRLRKPNRLNSQISALKAPARFPKYGADRFSFLSCHKLPGCTPPIS